MDTPPALSKLTLILWTLTCGPGILGQSTTLSSKSMLGFCDREYYVPNPKDTCDGGIYFGQRAPKCVCIKGIYRMHLSNCEVADGFAEEVCTLLDDVETHTKVKGVKLTKELDFSQVAAVYDHMPGKDPFDWAFLGEGERGKLSGKTFYTITGQAVITSKGKRRRICVQKDESKQNGGRICLYRHTDNVNIWPILDHNQRNLEITVRSTCDAQDSWTDLKPYRCFEPLTLLDSDCQLPCDKFNVFDRRTTPINTNGTADLDKNCTDPVGFVTHENDYLDRRLIHYLLMKALSQETPPKEPDYPPPSEETALVYALFEQVRDIAIGTCSFPFLREAFQKNAANLFMNLLRGNNWKYDISIKKDDYEWVRSILERCKDNVMIIPLDPDPKDESKEDVCLDPRATGYCRGEPGSYKHTPVIIPPKYSDYMSKHYVPEVVWLFLDIVHMTCFKHFEESYRMFHVLQQAIEKMFIVQIRDLWHNPTWTPGIKTAIMGGGAEISMWNLQICGASVYHYWNNTLHRLRRPDPFPYHTRKKRSAEHLSPNYDVYCAKTKQDFKVPDGCSPSNKNAQIIRPKVIFSGGK